MSGKRVVSALAKSRARRVTPREGLPVVQNGWREVLIPFARSVLSTALDKLLRRK